MKKYLSILLVAVFAIVLTGCGDKTFSCSLEEDGVIIDVKVSYNKNNIITKVSTVMEYEADTEEEAKQFAEYYEQNSTDGSTIKVDGKKITIKIVEEAKDHKDEGDVTKDELLADLNSVGYKCN